MHYQQITSDSVFDAVVVANGDFPTHHIPLSIAAHARCLCCCDRAGLTAFDHGLRPQAIVGDGDSLPCDFQKAHADIFHHVNEQDDNDLTKATRYVAGLGKRNIAYVGATGKRDDHTLANISLMHYYHSHLHLLPTMITDYGWFVIAEGNSSFDSFPRQQVSVFNLSCRTLRSRSLRWEVRPFTSLWQGTLNEATGDSVEIDADGCFMLYFTFDAKAQAD